MKRILIILALFLSLSAHAGEKTVPTTQDGWTLSTQSRDHYTGISLANGQVGMVTSPRLFSVQDILLNGVYDRAAGYDGVSNAVFAPNYMNVVLKVNGHEIIDADARNWHQELDLHHGIATTRFETDQATFQYQLMTLRQAPYMTVMNIEVTPRQSITLQAINQTTKSRSSKAPEYNYTTVSEGGELIPLYSMRCQTPHDLYQVATCASFIPGEKHCGARILSIEYGGTRALSLEQDIQAGHTYRFALVGAVCTTRDCYNPSNEAARNVLVVACNGTDRAIAAHKREWERIWQSDIEIEGDPESQLDVRSCLYHLYSFVGEDNRLSPSPMGLSSDGYNRHVFWDTEIWMFPPLLMLNQQMAKSCVDYRIDRMAPAQKRARMMGYRGIMFPWESDDSGEEATPLHALTGPLEQHITADVAIAAWNYYCVTRDRDWLRQSGYPLIRQVADFLTSRMERNADGTYSFRNVVGADEYAVNVDDNAYTNGTAQSALALAQQAAKVLGEKPDPQWAIIERNVKYHYMEGGIMREHATYDGQRIKQADVNLLSYPLGLMTDPKAVRANLTYYEEKIDPHGPAMGNCILSVLYSMLGDSEGAFRLFQKCYIPHKCPPFGVLSEGAGGNNPYFATGAGGMLQAVLAGFGGLRITDRGIVQQRPCLPPHWKSLTIRGVGPDKKTFTVRR